MIRFYSILPVFILFILIGGLSIEDKSYGSNCNLKLISKTNPITGKITFAGKKKFIFKNDTGDESLELLIVRQNKELTLRFKSESQICLPQAAEINLLTQDKKVMPLKSNSPDNCKGTMIFNFGGMFGKEKARDILYEKGILSLSFEDKDENGYFFSVQASEKEELKKSFNVCLACDCLFFRHD